ncbi:hypothetical protein niasHS_006902 [Heterodera schachtii]|uniref:Uncharacterized protein n=1 Tax=Heterodera schachtii TaxID=97005 RepID=A0ABD2JFW3_HETSC
MESKVGCSWRQLQLRGQQNSAKSKRVFGTYSSPHTFVVERENDGNSLLRFMKVVVPEYRELIPPPCLSTGFRSVQCRLNARMQSTESIGAAAPRQFRQNTETTMALNAFSDLEAIAEMGAGTDDAESQQCETATRPSSKLTGRCSPNPGNSLSSLTQQNAFTTTPDQRVRPIEQKNVTGGNTDSSHLAQMSVEQQRQRFGMNVVYRQQQPKQPIAPMGGINPTTGRLIMDSQPGLRHSSSSDVFNFVPDHSFEDTPNFGNISTTPYQSPTGVVRRRGRGRRAGNFGDRHPSTSSSIEHEGTPESPSDFGTLRKTRGIGNSGQRRPRKPRKPANVSFEQQEGIPRSPFQRSESHPTIGKIPPLPTTPSNYISPQIEEDFRSKMMSVYEMGICESSTDDEEMDPPPPPKELMAHNQSESSTTDQKTPPEINERAAGTVENSGNAAKKGGQPLAKCSVSSSQSSGGDQTAVADPPQSVPFLQDIKLIPTTTSSASSSPAFSQLSEQSDYRTPMAMIVKTEMDTNPKQQIVENTVAKAIELYDNEIDGMNSKKRDAEMDRLKQAKDAQAQNILALNKLPFSSCPDRTSKESFVKKESVDSLAAKRPALVLKIKKESGASSAASTKHSSSSSSPSSTSSSTAAPPALAAPTPQQQLNEPVARLSSSAAPPSKYKQQRQQTKRPMGKDETVTAQPTKKKQRKSSEMEGRPSSPSPVQQHRPSTTSSSTSNTTTTKWVKEGNTTAKSGANSTTTKKESALPNVISQITVPFPNLKNFKIPKVIENADPPPSTSSAPHFVSNKGGTTELQQQSNQSSLASSSNEKGSRSKFGPFKSSDHFEQRRPGGGAKQSKGAGHQHTHYQYNDKYAGGGGGSSFQPHNAYSRQRAPKQSQAGGGGRHGGGNSEQPRKQHGAAPSTTRPTSSSSTAGHRFTVQFQQHSRDGGSAHNQQHPFPPSLQHFPAQQQLSGSVGWQAVQPTTGEFFQQQQNHNYLPQQQQQKLEWFGQANNDQEHRQTAGHSTSTVRPNQTRTTDRQSGNCREEDRMDNSPSTGNGLQIVDDE